MTVLFLCILKDFLLIHSWSLAVSEVMCIFSPILFHMNSKDLLIINYNSCLKKSLESF